MLQLQQRRSSVQPWPFLRLFVPSTFLLLLIWQVSLLVEARFAAGRRQARPRA